MDASSSAPGTAVVIEFRSVVDAVRCAIEVQNGMAERNAGLPPERRIEFRIGIHLGDVVEESDGDLMGDGVNIAARLEGIAEPGAICLSEDAYRQVKGRLDLAVTDLGQTELKNIAESDPGLFACRSASPPRRSPPLRQFRRGEKARFAGAARRWDRGLARSRAGHGGSWRATGLRRSHRSRQRRSLRTRRRLLKPGICPSSCCLSPTSQTTLPKIISPMASPRTLTTDLSRPQRRLRDRAQHRFHIQGQECRRPGNRQGAWRPLRARRVCPARPRPPARERAAHRRGDRQSPLGRPLRQARWPISWICRTRSSPASPTNWGRS